MGGGKGRGKDSSSGKAGKSGKQTAPALINAASLKFQQKATQDVVQLSKKIGNSRITINDIQERGISIPTIPAYETKEKVVKGHSLTFDQDTGDLIGYSLVFETQDNFGNKTGEGSEKISVPSVGLYFHEKVRYDLASKLEVRKAANPQLGHLLTILEPSIWCELSNYMNSVKFGEEPRTFAHFKAHLAELGLSYILVPVKKRADAESGGIDKKSSKKRTTKITVELDIQVAQVLVSHLVHLIGRMPNCDYKKRALEFVRMTPGGEASMWVSNGDDYGPFPNSMDFANGVKDVGTHQMGLAIKGHYENDENSIWYRDNQPVKHAVERTNGFPEGLAMQTKNILNTSFSEIKGGHVIPALPSVRTGIGMMLPLRTHLPKLSEVLTHQLISGVISDARAEAEYNFSLINTGGWNHVPAEYGEYEKAVEGENAAQNVADVDLNQGPGAAATRSYAQAVGGLNEHGDPN
jgi:hypothetical protein